jgi:chromosome segregation ATPase
VDAARHHIEELVGEVEAARAAHTERDAAEAALRDHIARNERDLADERMTIADLAQQLDVARVAAESQQQQIAEARANIDALVAELEVARAGADMQNQEIEAARSHIEALGEEIAVARAAPWTSNDRSKQRKKPDRALVSRFEDASRSAAERARREAALRTDVVRLAEEAACCAASDALAPVLRARRRRPRPR